MTNSILKIYFGASIRGGRDDVGIYTQIIEMLKQYGTVLTEHIGDKKLTQAGEQITEEDIYARDMNWLQRADKRVFEITNPSFGVGYEVGKAEEIKGSTLCIWRKKEDKKISAMAKGNPNILIKEYKEISDLKSIFDSFFNN